MTKAAPRIAKDDPLQMLRTWIEIDAAAARKNYDMFRRLIARGSSEKTKFWSVVKSNAYGHGLYAFSELMDEFGVDGFCVDSVVEALSLRRTGIKKPILVLGQTLASRYPEAAKEKIIITISNFAALAALQSLARKSMKQIPDFHVKIDTGMHRQGFYIEDVPKIIKILKLRQDSGSGLAMHFCGMYTHFASAKDLNYPGYTERQLKIFKETVALFEKAGFKNLIKHAAATGGTLIDPKYHLDAVRIGIGLYGLWPSRELEIQLGDKMKLHPVLSWRTVISEVKQLKKGDYVGYDSTERVSRNMTMAVLPIGYWHGFPRALSSKGEIAVSGHHVRVLGRVSMDMTAIEVPRGTRSGSIATIIGGVISADDQAAKSGTSNYEFVTRLNPLMERVIIR